MIGEEGVLEGIGRQDCVQVRSDENGAVRLLHHHRGEIQHVLQTLLAAGSDQQHEVAIRMEPVELRLMGVVAAEFSFDAFDVQL